MRHAAKFQRFQAMAMSSPGGQRPRGKAYAAPDLRSEAEDLLREMAFVLHVTRSLKQAMLSGSTAPRTAPAGPRASQAEPYPS